MRIKWLLNQIRPFFGIVLISLGGVYEHFFGPALIAWAIIVAGFLYLYLTETGRPRHTPLEHPLWLLSLMVVLSVLITATIDVTFVQASRFFAGIAMLYAFVFWARERWQLQITAVALICLGALLAVTAPMLVSWHLNKGGIVPEIIYALLPSPLISDPVHPNIMASLLILLMPIAAAFVIANWPRLPGRSPQLFIMTSLAYLLMGMTFLLTKSRGGYLAAVLSSVVLLWWFRWRKTAVLLLTCVALITLWLGTAGNSATSQDMTDTSTVAFRLDVWHMALTMTADFPFTGVGMGTFNDVASRLYPFPPNTNPGTHNLFLQVAIDLGLIGLVAFIALCLLTFYMGRRAMSIYWQRQDNVMFAVSAGALAGFLGLLLHGLVDNTVWGTRMAFLPWVVVGLITAVHLSALAKE